MRTLTPFLAIAAFLMACTSTNESGEVQSYIIETHPNGLTKTEYRYAGEDSLNREHIEYHTNGKVFITGKMQEGRREGEWKSFHPNGQPWSVQSYFNGRRDGETKNWFENGQLRYTGAYANDDRFGRWVFFNEQGDTVKVADF